MTTHKRTKFSRNRGTHTHGGGAKKKRRGAGHRGGRGMAGTGKRADQKWPSVSDKDYFGKYGFKKKNSVPVLAVTLAWIDNKITSLAAGGKAEVRNGVFHLDLSKLGYHKLIGTGIVNTKLMITVQHATEGAIEKIKKAGGSVVLVESKEPKAASPQEKDSK